MYFNMSISGVAGQEDLTMLSGACVHMKNHSGFESYKVRLIAGKPYWTQMSSTAYLQGYDFPKWPKLLGTSQIN